MDKNATSVKFLSVIFRLSVNPLIIKLSTDLLTGKFHKKKSPALFHQYFYRECCHIIDRNTVYNSIGDKTLAQ
jgi:hypothetical protein